MEMRASSKRNATWGADDRDRSAIAVVELIAGCTLIVAMFLPWFIVRYTTDPSAPDVIAIDPASLSWVSHHDFGQTIKNVLIPYGPLAAVACAAVGVAMPGLGRALAIIAAFGAAGAGALIQLQQISSGGADTIGFSTTTPGFGLWLFAGAAVLGIVAGLADVRHRGSSTLVSRMLVSASSTNLVVVASGATAVFSVGTWSLMGIQAAFYLLFALLVALILVMPSMIGAAMRRVRA